MDFLLSSSCKHFFIWFYAFFQAFMSLNDIDSAVDSFSKALELEPDDGESERTTFSLPNVVSG